MRFNVSFFRDSVRLLVKSVALFSLSLSFLHADCWKKSFSTEYYIGPEVYHVERQREGGSSQHGMLYGGRVGMDRIKRYKYYWGADYLLATGELNGKSGSSKLHSKMTDSNLEARFGYTFGTNKWRAAFFTPYVGLGYFSEKNCYSHPSPLPIHFKNEFGYIPFGFFSGLFITPNWSAGLNFKVRYLVDETVHVSHDPNHENHIQHYNEELQYRVELPIFYYGFICKTRFALECVPFYEYRPYGFRVNFPFDFLKTTFKLYGVSVRAALIF